MPNFAFGLDTQNRPRMAPIKKIIANRPLIIDTTRETFLCETKSVRPSSFLVCIYYCKQRVHMMNMEGERTRRKYEKRPSRSLVNLSCSTGSARTHRSPSFVGSKCVFISPAIIDAPGTMDMGFPFVFRDRYAGLKILRVPFNGRRPGGFRARTSLSSFKASSMNCQNTDKDPLI
jgi:hypothetical protein